MKKSVLFKILPALFLALSLASCSDDDNNTGGGSGNGATNAADADYTAANANAWHNYMVNVAMLLDRDASDLYEAWATQWGSTGQPYATLFKTHPSNFTYNSVQSCAQEIVEKCAEIANEVGSAKIGDPYSLYISGRTTEALYAVESWYSWHSRDDYTNNIHSIRNAYYGTLNGTIAEKSFAAALAGTAIDSLVRAAIFDAADAIQAIPQPFRNHINSTQSVAAMTACETLQRRLSDVEEGGVSAEAVNLKEAVLGIDATLLQEIIDNYVDAVVVPTYLDLRNKNQALLDAVNYLYNNRTNEAFAAACEAWLVAREPWEKSEAFLFGPVDELGLDPNMDSWPLDQNAIVQILNSQSWGDLEWSGDDSEEAVTAAQNVRGFHTLEFLLFKNGEPRIVE